MKTIAQQRGGFTLIEVLVVVVTVVLIVFAMLPMLTQSTDRATRSSRFGCVNNLKQMGLSFRLYSNDHSDRFPFAVPEIAGGTLEFTNSPQVFRHLQAMSNELVTPMVLVCPQDPQRTRTTGFSNLSNINLSYFVGLDATEADPQRLLSGDRHITGGTFTNGFLRLLKTNTPAGWTKELHVNAGNIGLSDCSASQTMAPQLQQQLAKNTLPVIRLAIP